MLGRNFLLSSELLEVSLTVFKTLNHSCAQGQLQALIHLHSFSEQRESGNLFHKYQPQFWGVVEVFWPQGGHVEVPSRGTTHLLQCLQDAYATAFKRRKLVENN